MRGVVLAMGLCLPLHAGAMCTDTAANDCDDDGFPASAGDCDDEDDAVHPGADEACNDADDDCDGDVDEGCDTDDVDPLAGAGLVGGQSCSVVPAGGAAWMLALLLPALGRRRR